MFFHSDGKAGKPKCRHRAIRADKIVERHVFQGAANRYVDPLPGAAYAAYAFVFAIPVAGRVLGDRYRAFEGIDDVRRRDVLRPPGQTVAAIGAPGLRDQSGAGQRLHPLGVLWRDLGQQLDGHRAVLQLHQDGVLGVFDLGHLALLVI